MWFAFSGDLTFRQCYQLVHFHGVGVYFKQCHCAFIYPLLIIITSIKHSEKYVHVYDEIQNEIKSLIKHLPSVRGITTTESMPSYE